MKRRFFLALILVLGFALRFYRLGGNPSSLDWDEASLGYNAYSIIKTGRDEYGNFMPLSFRSFGDYKPPLYVYLSTLPVALFGLNEFSTRFLSAFAGITAVWLSYFMIREMLGKKYFKIILLSVYLFSLSPWHIQFSRVAFEANVSLSFFLTGLYFFLRGLKNSKYILASLLIFDLSMYTYHSARLVVPVFLTGALFLNVRYFWEKKLRFGLFVILAVILVLPIFITVNGSAARFGSVGIFNPNERLEESIAKINYDMGKGDIISTALHNRRLIYAREVLGGYLNHFNFDYLFLNGDLTGRHHAADTGVLYIFEFPFILLGAYFILTGGIRYRGIFLVWFAVAPLASAMTKATPHAVRSLLYLPSYQILAACGMWIMFSNGRKYLYLFKYLTVVFLILNVYYYLHQYWIHTPVEYAYEWQYGYKQMVYDVSVLGKTKKSILVTYAYDQPYVYFLFYDRIDPSWYQNEWNKNEIQRDIRVFGKYQFRKLDWSKDSQLTDTLLVGTPDEIPAQTSGLVKEINYPDGSVAFRIVEK